MTPLQRAKAFDRYFSTVCRTYADHLGIDYAGTIRKVPPPPLPGEIPERARYFINGARKGSPPRLVEFTPKMYALVRKAETWLETGKGAAPRQAASKPGQLKRKI